MFDDDVAATSVTKFIGSIFSLIQTCRSIQPTVSNAGLPILQGLKVLTVFNGQFVVIDVFLVQLAVDPSLGRFVQHVLTGVQRVHVSEAKFLHLPTAWHDNMIPT